MRESQSRILIAHHHFNPNPQSESSMASTLLALHNVIRWLVLLLAVIALLRALKGLTGGVDFATGAKRALALFTISTHVQLLIGLLLYAVSPVTRHAMADTGAAMSDAGTRFFLVEHPTVMVFAVIIVTATGVIARRGPDDAVKHRRAAIGVAIALLLLLAGMPWQRPFIPHF